MYVNHLGQPIDIEAMKSTAKKKTATPSAEYHKGWKAVGYSPSALQRARAEHEAEQERARAAGGHSKPWSAEAWMRTHKPEPIRRQPYEIREAAVLACELAAKHGWVGCFAQPMSKSKG